MNKHGRPLRLVAHDSIVQLKEKIKTSKDEAFRIRLRAIVKAFEGKKQSVIAEELAVCSRGISAWIRKYRISGTEGLRTKSSGRPAGNPKWDPAIFSTLTKEIDKGGYWSIPRMQEWIAKKYGVHIPEQTVWFRMDALNYSYKSARPHPTQGNREKQETFKKGVSARSWSR
jgi:transposase